MEKNNAGKEDQGGNLSWIAKNEFTDKVTCDSRSERNEGVRHVPIWAGLWGGEVVCVSFFILFYEIYWGDWLIGR